MKPRTQTAGLVAILFTLTVAMGLSFGGPGTGGGASDVRSSTISPSPSPSTAPKVIVVAHGINPQYLYQSSFYGSIPGYMLQPMVGVRVALTSLDRETISFRQRLPALVLRTNLSGIAVGFVAPGNYSVSMSGPNMNISTDLFFRVNSTTTLGLSLLPSSYPVDSLHLVSPDTTGSLEPTARVSVLLSNQSAPAFGFAELLGFGSNLGPDNTNPGGYYVAFNQIAFNATVLGSYPEGKGYWAVLSPTGSYEAYPTLAVVLFQFRPVLEVNSTAR